MIRPLLATCVHTEALHRNLATNDTGKYETRCPLGCGGAGRPSVLCQWRGLPDQNQTQRHHQCTSIKAPGLRVQVSTRPYSSLESCPASEPCELHHRGPLAMACPAGLQMSKSAGVPKLGVAPNVSVCPKPASFVIVECQGGNEPWRPSCRPAGRRSLLTACRTELPGKLQRCVAVLPCSHHVC